MPALVVIGFTSTAIPEVLPLADVTKSPMLIIFSSFRYTKIVAHATDKFCQFGKKFYNDFVIFGRFWRGKIFEQMFELAGQKFYHTGMTFFKPTRRKVYNNFVIKKNVGNVKKCR
jgi:hypothetical protein